MLAVSASAADMPAEPYAPYQAPIEPVVPAFSWSGFYVGGNVGYGWARTEWTGGAGNFTTSPDGFQVGGTGGYNFQTGAFVFGIEGDIDYVDLNGTAVNNLCATCTIKDTWLATLRGRVGYAFGRWLPYFTGGGAWGNVYVSSPAGSGTSTKGGWSAGGGVEYSWDRLWSAKLEYLYADLGDANCPAATCGTLTDVNLHYTQSILRAGINYHF
jgi:outer membrane immunogenic protein